MNKLLPILFVLISLNLCGQSKSNVALKRQLAFDDHWLFSKGKNDGADKPNYNDSQWRKLDLPHDWSIEDLPNPQKDSIIGPFDKGSVGGFQAGFAVGGTGWYRKKFSLNKVQENKRTLIHFDGIYANSDVWLNGHHLGVHPHGYTAFHYDLTPFLKPAGKENVLAVKVNCEGRNSRWYSGAGIYRHVSLTFTGDVNIAPWGIAVTTPIVSAGSASINIKSAINNQQTLVKNVSLITTIFSPEGKVVSRNQKSVHLTSNLAILDNQDFNLKDPSLWSSETPFLYKVITEIKDGKNILDHQETSFGIRSVKVDAVNGLTINGKKILLKGGCIHHDNGPLGAAAIDRAEERKIEILKKNGYNAVRTSHNPPSTYFLEACDRLGMMVIDEAFDMWETAKTEHDYHLSFKDCWQKDLKAMILSGRNHPSVIIWSIGNEIPERINSEGLRITKQLADETRRLDPTRPITEAHCRFFEAENHDKDWDETATAFALLDIGGYNYLAQHYEEDHKLYPDRVMLATETYPSAIYENWTEVEKKPYLIGDFVWTALDYLGEASVGNSYLDTKESKKRTKSFIGWPWFNAFCGDIDLIGNKKVQSYYRDIVWRNAPIAMAVHRPIPEGMVEKVSKWGWPDELLSWTWPGVEGKPLQVRVFSRAPIVRLKLNGKIIGEQKLNNGITAVFHVPYQPGVLKAVNVVNGKETDAFEFSTAGSPKRIRLTADRSKINADRNDLSYVMVEVIDKKGQVVPDADVQVQFSLTGAGEIAAVGNSSPTDMASFQEPERKTINGKCLVIVRPNGTSGSITLRAQGANLEDGKIVITTN